MIAMVLVSIVAGCPDASLDIAHAKERPAPPDSLVLDIDLVLGSTDAEAEYFFGTVSSVVQDSHGCIYVGDYRQSTIFKFDASGRLVARHESVGEGPGDIMPFFSMAMDREDNLYLVGQGGRVAVIDSAFEHKASFQRSNPSSVARGIGVLPDGAVVVAAVNLSNHTTIDLYDPSFAYRSSFSDTYAIGADVPWREETTYAGGSLAVAGNGDVLFVQLAPYSVRRFRPSGELLAETATGGAAYVPPPPKPEVDGDRVTFKFLAGTTGVAPAGDHGVLVSAFRRDTEERSWSRLCLYDSELVLIGRREREGLDSVVGSCSDGRVFIQRQGDDGTRVVRARVERVGS